MKYLPLYHHFKATCIYQFPKHIIVLVKIVANASSMKDEEGNTSKNLIVAVMVVGFIIISLPITTNIRVWTPLRWGVLNTTLCDKVCQWLAAGRWFSSGTPVSSTNKTDRHDITEILLKVVLNTITLTP